MDLSTDDQDVANIAMVYLSDDLNDESAEVIENVKGKLNYTIDDACSSPLFSARDISLQRILVDGKTKSEWVALVQLNSESPEGYLQHEVQQCKSLGYIPQGMVSVQVNMEQPVTVPCKRKRRMQILQLF